MTQPQTSPFSLTYGEETKLPLTVCAAVFHIKAAISQQLALVVVRLTVCNNYVTKDIEATLRLPLPDSDATVCGFSVGPDLAIAVPKAKATEVAYKEKEKGRAVATANKVSGATWETTVYPLPYNQMVEVTVQFVCNMTADGAVALPLVFAAPVERITVSAVDADDGTVGVDNLGGGATGSTMPDGLHVAFESAATEGRIVSAEHNGSLFWSGRVPRAALDRAFAAVQATATPAAAALTDEASEAHVGIVVDTSRSCAPMAEARLACLAALDASYASCGRRVRFTVWSFSRRASCLGERMETAAAHAVLAAVRYDGGTDLSLLGGESGLLNEAGPLGKGCDEGALQLTHNPHLHPLTHTTTLTLAPTLTLNPRLSVQSPPPRPFLSRSRLHLTLRARHEQVRCGGAAYRRRQQPTREADARPRRGRRRGSAPPRAPSAHGLQR